MLQSQRGMCDENCCQARAEWREKVTLQGLIYIIYSICLCWIDDSPPLNRLFLRSLNYVRRLALLLLNINLVKYYIIIYILYSARFYCCPRPLGAGSNPEARCSFFKWDERSKPLAKPKFNCRPASSCQQQTELWTHELMNTYYRSCVLTSSA